MKTTIPFSPEAYSLILSSEIMNEARGSRAWSDERFGVCPGAFYGTQSPCQRHQQILLSFHAAVGGRLCYQPTIDGLHSIQFNVFFFLVFSHLVQPFFPLLEKQWEQSGENYRQ